MGSFYATDLTFGTYEKAVAVQEGGYVLQNALKFQEEALKTVRFLYNYSTLHRNFLQHTHRLTTVKRLLLGTFYDRKLFTKNMWASNTFALLQNPTHFLKSELDLLYRTAGVGSVGQGRSLLNLPILHHTSFYEESFF